MNHHQTVTICSLNNKPIVNLEPPIEYIYNTAGPAEGSPARLSHSASSPAKLSEAGKVETPVKLRHSASSDSLDSQLPEEIVARLLGGVSFGFGSFQVRVYLCINIIALDESLSTQMRSVVYSRVTIVNHLSCKICPRMEKV